MNIFEMASLIYLVTALQTNVTCIIARVDSNTHLSKSALAYLPGH